MITISLAALGNLYDTAVSFDHEDIYIDLRPDVLPTISAEVIIATVRYEDEYGTVEKLFVVGSSGITELE